MTIIASDSYASGLTAGQSLTGRAMDNALGGSGTRNYVVFTPSGVGLLGTGSGAVYGVNALAVSLVDAPTAKMARVRRDPLAATSNMVVYGCTTNAATGERIAALLIGGNSLRFSTFNSSGTRTDRVSLAIPSLPVPAGCFIELDWRDPTALCARILNSDGSVRNETTPWNATANGYTLPIGTLVGYGFFQGGNTGNFDDFIIEDGPTFAKPVLSSPTGSATGPNSSTGTVSTDVGNGVMYWLDATSLPTEAAILAANSRAVTATGVQTGLTSSGLTASTTGYRRYYVHRRAEGVNSDITQSPTFNTPAPVANPVIQSVTATARGTTVTVKVRMASGSGPVTGVQITVPAHATPEGAVTLGPLAATYDGSDWVAVFTGAATGRYSFASATATGPDAGTDTEVAAKTLRIIPLTGTAQA